MYRQFVRIVLKFVLHLRFKPMYEVYHRVKELLEKFLLDIPLSANTFPYRTFVKTDHTSLSLSSMLAGVRQKVMMSPVALQRKCSLKPWHYPIVVFPHSWQIRRKPCPKYRLTLWHKGIMVLSTIADAGTSAKSIKFHESHQLEHELYKAVVGYCCGKINSQMHFHKKR